MHMYMYIYIYIYIYISPENNMGTSLSTTSPQGQTGAERSSTMREVRVNSWCHLMQQHAAHSVKAESNQLPTRPGLWPPAPEKTYGNSGSCNRPCLAGCLQTSHKRFKAMSTSSRPGRQSPNLDRDQKKDHSGGLAGSQRPQVTKSSTRRE